MRPTASSSGTEDSFGGPVSLNDCFSVTQALFTRCTRTAAEIATVLGQVSVVVCLFIVCCCPPCVSVYL